MMPDAATIDRMAARGWPWEPCPDLYAGGFFWLPIEKLGLVGAVPAMRLVVYSNGQKWSGLLRLGAGPPTPQEVVLRHATPDGAADEVEKWVQEERILDVLAKKA